ncbi:putative lipoprotein [Atopobium sp. BS2]|nr:putative lipoprotein [Atopobium sp. BS2]
MLEVRSAKEHPSPANPNSSTFWACQTAKPSGEKPQGSKN